MWRRQEDFVYSKCDRCGKATTGTNNGTDLTALPPEWDHEMTAWLVVCTPCFEKYTREEWIAWYEKRMARGV